VIRLEGVGHVYAARSPWSHRALTGVDLTIRAGELVVVAGPNGSGKSTLAWILAGLLRPTEGTVTIDGRPIVVAEGATAVAFQDARLQLFRPTVADDVRVGLDLGDDHVDAALDIVGLDPDLLRDRRIDDLSGGQQRRVALAGVLVRRPRLLVLDEPLAGLDGPGRVGLAAVLRRLRDYSGLAAVTVTHDLDHAAALGDRAVLLDDGRVVADGPTATVLESPAVVE
jgi:energy-coupling factor transport system ATP-binding protein